MFPLTDEENIQYNNSTICHIYNKYLAQKDKCRDHCHLTGKFRGAAHKKYNILYQQSHNIPIVFHNLSGYDSHFIIESVAKCFPGSVYLLPINKEKFIGFTKKVDDGTTTTIIQLRFIDSFRFMASSIEKFASYLNDADLIITRNNIPDPQQFALVTRKGIFPYEFVDSWDKLNYTQLPDQHKFLSKLSNSNVSNKDYEHAQKVWNTFNIKTLGEYSDLYLKTDVLLLSDIFQNFRKTCKKTYNLDQLHYYTAPGLAFDAMLKYTQVSLDLLNDPAMLLFFEKGIRGGVAQCSNRYADANNPFMGDEYNPDQENSYIMYFDVNNLYGAAMSQCLPTGSFK
ncbi:GSCOCG00012387001-RA-CDS [Cotesia congregata]|nr:GSCOCG00012387001-RA-CDS [Cotesia congregata]